MFGEIPGAHRDWQPYVPQWEGVPDFSIDHELDRKCFFDVVCPLAVTYESAGTRRCVAASKQEATKRRKYKVIGADGRRQVPFDFTPLAFEAHGAWGKSSVIALRKYAKMKAESLRLDASYEVARWRAVVSCAVQRGNSALLLRSGCTRPLRGAGADLPLVG